MTHVTTPGFSRADMIHVTGDLGETATNGVEYRDVDGFPGYRVGTDGTVWSRYSGDWKCLKPVFNSRYFVVSLYAKGVQRLAKVHRLVLEEFVGHCPSAFVCRHLDGNPANNALANLTWGTHQENTADKDLHGRLPRGEAHPSAKISDADAEEIRRLYSEGFRQVDLAKMFGVNQPHISRIVRGLRKNAPLNG